MELVGYEYMNTDRIFDYGFDGMNLFDGRYKKKKKKKKTVKKNIMN